MAITRIGNIANTLPDNSIANSKFTDIVNFKNIIINGDMSIAQRGTSTASITSTGYYTCDRWSTGISVGTFTQTQSTDVPTGQGFASSLKMECTGAETPVAADQLFIGQRIEGQNLQYLKKGTANAESLTASFWVKSNKTGTYILELFDNDNLRSINKSYTIDTANTWEKKEITFAGDTTGAFDNNNGLSLYVSWWLGAGTDYTSGTLNTSWNPNTKANRAVGQVQLADTVSNNFFITGVQLEAGTTASDFEFLPVDVNKNRCFRYFEKGDFGANGLYTHRTTGRIDTPRMRFHTEKRATPTITVDDSADNVGKVSRVDIEVTGSTNQNGAAYASIYSVAFYSSSGINATGIYGNFKADAEL